MFKSYKLLFPIVFLALLFTACEKENIDIDGVDTQDPPTTTLTDTNPLLSRSGGGNGAGLDLDCFEINFPFSVVDIDGNEHELVDEDAFIASLETIEIVDFKYPLDVTLEDGTQESVADGEALAELFATCVPAGGWERGDFPAYLINYDNSCYELVYPLDVVNENDVVTTIENEADLNATIAEELVFFVFPIELRDEDDLITSVADIDEMFNALIACNGDVISDTSAWEWEYGFEYIGCYLVEFPFDVVLQNGDVVTVEDHMQFCDLLLTGELVSYAFPLSLIDDEGNIVTVADQEELDALLDECFDYDDSGDGYFFAQWLLDLATTDYGNGTCYDISYPIQYEDFDENVMDINSDTEFVTTLGNPFNFKTLVYPITITNNTTGLTVSLTANEDIFEVPYDCN